MGAHHSNTYREGIIDQFLERNPGVGAIFMRLLHHDIDHVEFGIDAEVSAAAAVPFQFANRTRRPWFCLARIGAHGEAIAVPEPIAWKIEVVAPDARARSHMIRRHVLECRRAEKAPAVKLAAIKDHLRKAPIIDDGRDKSTAAGFPLRMRAALALRVDENRIAW